MLLQLGQGSCYYDYVWIIATICHSSVVFVPYDHIVIFTIDYHDINQTNSHFPGGQGVVFLAKANSVRYALKRMYVNNEYDMNVAKREIQIAVSSLPFFL